MSADGAATDARIAQLEQLVQRLQHETDRNAARGAVENLFSTYMLLHNAFLDEQIVELWVRPGTPGIMARYTNNGKYTTYDSVMEYHRGRPTPVGKLIFHYTTTPVIEVAGDGETAKGVWIVAGLESGVTTPAQAAKLPDFMFSPKELHGNKVWAHWVWVKYELDFLKQDGVWRIWKFRCVEVARAPYEENWISFAEKNAAAFDLDIKYFGDDGEVVFMPPTDEPIVHEHWPYRPDARVELAPKPPVPYRTYADIDAEE